MTKPSPFFIIEDFISPLQCEKILQANVVKNDIGSIRILNEGVVPVVRNSILDYKSEISNRFSAELSDDIKCLFVQTRENAGVPALRPQIDGWEAPRRRWVKTKNIDLVGFIPLKTFCDNVPIDVDFEVYGGKLEMINFNFSILPERGSLILMPAAPNFMYAISPVNFGTLEFIKFYCRFEIPWTYDSSKFSSELSSII